jgi:hypothetical protein
MGANVKTEVAWLDKLGVEALHTPLSKFHL